MSASLEKKEEKTVSETLEEKIKRMQAEKEAVKSGAEKKLMDEFTGNAAPQKDMSQIAEELKARKEKMEKSKLDGYKKDTLYIRSDIYDAFNALCVKQGQKKTYVNEALHDFVLKKYKEMEKGE